MTADAGRDALLTWCDLEAGPGHTFCDDFDKGLDPTLAHGSVSLDSDAAVSPPNSLLAVNTGSGGGPSISRTFPFAVTDAPQRVVRLHTSMRLDGLSLAAEPHLLQIDLDGSSSYSVFLFIWDNQGQAVPFLVLYPDSTGSFQRGLTTSGVTFNGWYDVDLTVDLAGNVAVATIANVGQATIKLDPLASFLPARAGFEVGVPYMTSNAGAVTSRFDNLVFDVR